MVDSQHNSMRDISASMVKPGGSCKLFSENFLRRKDTTSDRGTLVNRDWTSNESMGAVSKCGCVAKIDDRRVVRSCEFVRCALEKVPTSGARILAMYLESGVIKAEHWDIIGLKVSGG